MTYIGQISFSHLHRSLLLASFYVHRPLLIYTVFTPQTEDVDIAGMGASANGLGREGGREREGEREREREREREET